MKKGVIALLFVLALAGCSRSTLDSTDLQTFQDSYSALIEGMEEQEQLEVTWAMVSVAKADKYGTGAPGFLANRLEVESVLDPSYRETALAQVYVLGHEALDGKTADQLATEYYSLKTVSLKADLQEARLSLSKVDDRAGDVLTMRNEAKERYDQAEEQRQRDLEQLALVSVALLDYNITQFRPPHARGEFVVQVINTSDVNLEETVSRLHWKFGETEGERPLLFFKPGRSFEAGGLGVGETSKPGKVAGINVDLGEAAPRNATADDILFTVSALSITVDGRDIRHEEWANPFERDVLRAQKFFDAVALERSHAAREVERLELEVSARK